VRKRGLPKSPVRKNRTPGSVRGALRRPYRDWPPGNLNMHSEMQHSGSPARLGLCFGAIHFVLFMLSTQIARQAEGWAGVYVWPVWFVVDLPWGLLYFLPLPQSVSDGVLAARASSATLDAALYAPYVIHGLIGTLWWAALPSIRRRIKAWRATP
jgi:hypothetical protein